MSGDWQSHFRSLSKRAQHIYQNQILFDCEFIVRGELEIKCHKLILAMGSPVFQAMFYGCNPEPSGPIKIPDIDPFVFKQIIEYIYDQELKIDSHKNACDLYYGAKKYLLTLLERDCIEYLKNNLQKENALYLYEFAKFHSEAELEKLCMIEIQVNMGEVLENANMENVSEEALNCILDLNIMNISSELVLFKAVEKWALLNLKDESSGDLKKEDCLSLLKKIRFLSLSVEEFASGPSDSPLLSDSLKLALLLRISNAVKKPMDNGFCELRKKRKPANFKCMSVLDIKEISEARCDGSEWLTSIFKSSVAIDLLGVEIKLQVDDEPGDYLENLMVKVGYAGSEVHLVEGGLCGVVQYNTSAQVMFNDVCTLNPSQEYAIHIFLCTPGMYPIGRHSNLICENQTVTIEFVSHSSWERAHPYNTTVLSSIIYSDHTED